MVSRAAFTRVQSLPEASPTMKNPELSSFLAYNSSRLAFTWSPEPSTLTQFESEMALVQLTKVKNKSCLAGAPEWLRQDSGRNVAGCPGFCGEGEDKMCFHQRLKSVATQRTGPFFFSSRSSGWRAWPGWPQETRLISHSVPTGRLLEPSDCSLENYIGAAEDLLEVILK